jgi:hypothetical protein
MPGAGETGHVLDLLPALANGTLDLATAATVRAHLADCQNCAAASTQWETLRATLRLAAEPAVLPSPLLLDRVWAAIDAAPAPLAQRVPFVRRARFALRFLVAQALVVPRGIWAVSAVAMGASLLMILVLTRDGAGVMLQALLGLIVPLVTALGAAFIYGPENDAALELTLATPISPRLVAASRVALLLGYNFALATLLTLAAVATHGGSFAALAALWLGPAVLLAGLSLLLSLVVSSVAGVVSTAILLATRLIVLLGALPEQTMWLWAVQVQKGWTTGPAVLLLGILAVGLALWRVPRQERLAL